MSRGEHRTDVAVIGGGTATEALVRELDGSGLRITVFEPGRVGGVCPFTACMPSKAMLHDAATGTPWPQALANRHRVAEGLDDTGHADDLRRRGAELVRAAATIGDHATVEANGERWHADHLVIATGATPVMPDVRGLDALGDRCWTSDDALTSDHLPTSLVVLGGGVIGMECAFAYAGFGSEVALVEQAPELVPDAPPAVRDVLTRAFRARGIRTHLGAAAARAERAGDGVVLHLDDGSTVTGDRVLVVVGRRAATDGIGLERLGLDPTDPLPVGPTGRVRCDGSVWAMGDVAGLGQYTHLANHQAAVVAAHLAGDGERTFDEVVVSACTFTTPPQIQVGPSYRELHGDADVVGVGHDLSGFPRAITDGVSAGHLWVAARRSTGCIVAASGIGPQFDDVVHALVVAIDGRVPVSRLRRSVQPFPTYGEILGPLFDELHQRLAAPS